MSHQRKVIRDAIVTALTNATSAGARVKATRIPPNNANELPAIAVYTPSEETDDDSIRTSPRELLRHLTVHIRFWVLETVALHADDAMDALALQVETAMDVDRFLGGAAGGEVGSVLLSTDAAVSDDGDPMVGQATLTYRVDYYSSPAAPVLANDYLRTGTTTDIDGTGTAATTGDLFNQQP